MSKLGHFIKDLKQEISKVSWPSRKLVQKASLSIIIFSLFFGIYLWVIDLAFTRLIHFLLALRGS